MARSIKKLSKMSTLEEIFKNLDAPDEEVDDVFKTELIFGKYHRIGKNYKGLPSILIFTKKDEKISTPYKRMNLRLRFNINCKIKEKDQNQKYNFVLYIK